MENEKEKEKGTVNIRSATFHSEIYHNQMDWAVENLGVEGARKELSDFLSHKEARLLLVDRKKYFDDLVELFNKTEWNHLLLADKARFFRNWYVAISDEYIKAFTIFRHISPDFTGLAYYLDAVLHDKKKFEDYFGVKSKHLITRIKAHCNNIFWEDLPEEWRYFYVLCLHVFGIHVDQTGRNRDLKYSFRKELLDEMDAVSAYSIETMPAWIGTTSMKADDLAKLRSQVGVVPIFVNLKYQEDDIANSIETLIKQEREKFFLRCPQQKTIYKKEDIKGRRDTYPFEEWRSEERRG